MGKFNDTGINHGFRAGAFVLALAAMLLAILGCKRNEPASAGNSSGKINVAVTIFAPYDFVRNIAGEKVNLFMLLPPGSESHSYEPSPRDIIAIQNSDIFIYTGGESDKWVNRILQSMDSGRMKILSMMEAVEAVEEETTEGMEVNEAGEEKEYDEHVWTSPQNAILIVRSITELLCEADAANGELYRQNANAYIDRLEQLDDLLKGISGGGKRKTIVFGDRFPFRYFADAYSLKYFAAFPGCSAETEPSAATVAFLIRKVKEEKIPVVFHIELSNERMADTISEETGAIKLLLHACHNITKRDFDAGLGYLDLMGANAENLRKALN